MPEVVESLSMAEAIDIIDGLDDVLRKWFDSEAVKWPETISPVIAKYVMLMVWMKLRAYMVFSKHDYEMLANLAQQITDSMIKAGTFPKAPEEEIGIVSVHTVSDDGKPKN